ncbi:MAG: hypothetical protein LUD55_00795 [Oscillospiraceae bacterium]|nr:hypothetical protein [Oscillospiraceae bacterium]
MFTNVEKKLKVLAVVIVCFGAISIISFIIFSYSYLMGFLIGIVCLLISIIEAWVIYAFAELLETAKETARVLKIGFSDNIEKDLTRAKQLRQQQAEQEEKARQEEAEAQRKAKERQKAEELAKQARIDAYWVHHAEEKDALLKKRSEASSKLNEMSGLAGKQRSALEDLIRAIDDELTKDREGE